MRLLLAIPLFNEERILETNGRKALHALRKSFDDFVIVLVNNGSTDRTAEIAQSMARKYEEIRYLEVAGTGKGLALKNCWLETDADLFAFTDADLSADLGCLRQMVVHSKNYDVVIGSRYMEGSNSERSPVRFLYSLIYNWVINTIFCVQVSDHNCGLKLVTSTIKEEILPYIKSDTWFFDAELIIQSIKRGYRVKEVPVVWHENKNSHQNLITTPAAYVVDAIKLFLRLRWS